jgi:hypothetical protein
LGIVPLCYQKCEANVSQTTSAIRGQRAPANRREERRASVRHQSAVKGSCHTLNASREASWDAAVRDISTEGIGLVLGRRFEPGVLLSVEVPDNSDGQTRLLLARVVHATARPEGGWLIGCALLNPLTDDEVQALR